ncbi:MAG: AAA family ATPase [Candidatus Kapabacteria bacterium]|jgi:predicted ATP-binding protein involved in virulence|nr:AAA family ATPase [Candidatus Kapabacteria bacterium]
MAKKTTPPKAFQPTAPLPADAPYFYSLTLENIRCFADKQTLDLSDGKGNAARWTVILGENGTGKTTLLQLLAMLEPEFLIRDDNNQIFFEPTFRRNILTFRRTLNRNRTMGILETKFTALKELVKNQVNYHRSVLPGLTLLGITLTPKVELFSSWMNSFAIYGYGAKRHIGTNPWEEYRINDSAKSLFDSKSELINVAEWLRNLKLAASMSPQPNIHSKRFKKIESLLTSGLLPEVNAMRLAIVESGISGVEVTFHTPDGWVPLESLGLGYQTMIAWIVDFAARMVERYPDSPQPLKEPAIVLVDELDLHLHPRWQREIIGFLTKQFPKTQFIVTAHSPLVVQAAQDVNANIVLLRREGDHVVIDQNVRIDRNLTVDLLLASDAFGLEALYSPRTEELMREQESLQVKPHLSAEEQKRLKKIEQEIGVIPITSNPSDSEAMALIREAAELLKGKANGAGSKIEQTAKSKKKRTANGTHS